jgi:hypothetical protein
VLGRHFRVQVVVVTAGGAEVDGASFEPSGLALDALEHAVPLDGEVVACVLAERQEHDMACLS